MTDGQQARVEAAAQEYIRYCTVNYATSPDATTEWPDVVRSATAAGDGPLREYIRLLRSYGSGPANVPTKREMQIADELEALVLPQGEIDNEEVV